MDKAKVLIVEDEPMLLDLVAKIFETHKLKVDTATDGVQALHKLEQNKYDIVLTDIQMPNMNGIELCKSIKQRSDIHQPKFWIALTAHLPEDFDTNQNLKLFDESFFKPLSPNMLAKMIQLKLSKQNPA